MSMDNLDQEELQDKYMRDEKWLSIYVPANPMGTRFSPFRSLRELNCLIPSLVEEFPMENQDQVLFSSVCVVSKNMLYIFI